MSDQPDSFAGLDPDDYVLTFAPALGRARHDGWTPDRQRRFVLALRQSGHVVKAALAVGCTPQSAYRLRKRPGAQAFATAWDRALDEARARWFEACVAAALGRHLKPLFYRGRFVRLEVGGDVSAIIAAMQMADRLRRPSAES